MAEYAMPLDAPVTDLDYDFRCFFLVRPRLEIFARIDERVEHMVRTLTSQPLRVCAVVRCMPVRGAATGMMVWPPSSLFQTPLDLLLLMATPCMHVLLLCCCFHNATHCSAEHQ